MTRINERIRVPEVRLIDDEGNQVGVLKIADALNFAQERDLDQVEFPFLCEGERVGRLQDADLFALIVDQAHLGHANALVDPRRVPLRRAPVEPSGYRH